MGSSCLIAPSLLAADPLHLLQAISEVVAAGAPRLHVDVMDNHYVPNLTGSPALVGHLKRAGITIPMDVHLMVKPVRGLVDVAIEAGAASITFHPDAVLDVAAELRYIRGHGVEAGLALSPSQPVSLLAPYLDAIDWVLLMTVVPGFGGQAFLPNGLSRIQACRAMLDAVDASVRPRLAVDGGVHPGNIASVSAQGADLAVVGSALFAHPPLAARFALLEADLDKAS
jgi:ribulose-phosphate 3-epimerase